MGHIKQCNEKHPSLETSWEAWTHSEKCDCVYNQASGGVSPLPSCTVEHTAQVSRWITDSNLTRTAISWLLVRSRSAVYDYGITFEGLRSQRPAA